MRVLIIHNVLWTHYKSVLFQEIEKQKPADLDICVLQIAKNDISRKDMEGPDQPYQYNYELLFDDYIELVPAYKKIWKVFKFILKYKPDVVNISGWGVDISITLSIIFCYFLRKKIIISNESTIIDQSRSFVKEKIKSLLVKMADGFIVFGKSSEGYILNLGGQKEQIIENRAAIVDDIEIKSIYNDSLSENYKNGEIPTKHNFIFIGRLVGVKNLPLLIRVFQKIKSNEQSNWGLIIVGSGEEGQKIRNLISNGSNDIFIFDGVDWKTVPKFFSRADCLVLSSFSETWGLVVNEAMICGLSVIISDQCGCKEDLIAGNGFVFKSNDEVELENAMIKMSNNQEILLKMKAKSVEIIEEYKVSEVAKRIIKGFTKIHKTGS